MRRRATVVTALFVILAASCGDSASEPAADQPEASAPAQTVETGAPTAPRADEPPPEPEEDALPKPKRPRPLHGVKRQPVFPDDEGDARAETEVIKYLQMIGGIDRWGLVEVDADAPLLTLTTRDTSSKSGLGLCTAGLDTSGEGNPEWERIVVLGGDGNPLALKEPGAGLCRSLVG